MEKAKVIKFPEKGHERYHEPGEPCDCGGPLKMVGYDDCIMGTMIRFGIPEAVFLYDYDKVLEKMVAESNMTYDEAVEYFDYNMLGSWVGDGTPAFFLPPTGEENGNEFRLADPGDNEQDRPGT